MTMAMTMTIHGRRMDSMAMTFNVCLPEAYIPYVLPYSSAMTKTNNMLRMALPALSLNLKKAQELGEAVRDDSPYKKNAYRSTSLVLYWVINGERIVTQI